MTNAQTISPAAAIREYADNIANLDVDAVLASLSDDVLLLAPFAPEGVPRRTEGKQAVAGAYGAVLGIFKSFAWHDVEVLGTDDPEVAVLTARSEVTLVNDTPYAQQYVVYVRVRDGLIVEVREYFDPAAATAAFASLQG